MAAAEAVEASADMEWTAERVGARASGVVESSHKSLRLRILQLSNIEFLHLSVVCAESIASVRTNDRECVLWLARRPLTQRNGDIAKENLLAEFHFGS